MAITLAESYPLAAVHMLGVVKSLRQAPVAQPWLTLLFPPYTLSLRLKTWA